ncbi:hypothetical protein ACYX34_14310 [Nitrospira sp. CMX1]
MKHVLFIAVLIIGIDQMIGCVLSRLYLHTTTGDSGGIINGVLRRKADFLVLGSSRAKHHVIPAILKKQLSGSVFNAGINGHDFLYAIMLLDIWTHAHAPPKAILLHIDYASLSYSEKELARTHVFSGYFGESERVRGILLMRGEYEWVKYLSFSYRFNGKVLSIIKNLVMRTDNMLDEYDGYVGLNGTFVARVDPVISPAESSSDEFPPFWELKLSYLSELARYCKVNGTRLILFHSPRYQEDSAALVDWSKRIADLQLTHEGVEYLDLSARSAERITGRSEYFRDVAHLNSKGAEVFSQILADEIARHLSLEGMNGQS